MWAGRLGRASTACAPPPGAPPAEGCPTCSANLPRHAWRPRSPAQPRAQGLELPGFCEMSSGSPSSANGDSRARCSLTAGMRALSATYGRAPSFSDPPPPVPDPSTHRTPCGSAGASLAGRHSCVPTPHRRVLPTSQLLGGLSFCSWDQTFESLPHCCPKPLTHHAACLWGTPTFLYTFSQDPRVQKELSGPHAGEKPKLMLVN